MEQLTKISKNNTKVYRRPGGFEVWLHKTCIVTVTRYTITLNTGGWMTNTTRDRMNQVANEKGLNYKVSFAQGVFSVSYRDSAGTWITVESPSDTLTLRRSA